MAEYEYDGDGTRISKTQNGVQTKYINDVGRRLARVLVETDSNDNTLASYTYGKTLISRNKTDANTFYHYDALGSTRQLTNDGGVMTVSYTYDGFGNVIAYSGASENVYRFTGEQFDSSSRLLFLRARYYDSSTGRFLSPDPLGMLPNGKIRNWFKPLKRYAHGINIYSYVRNNPVNKIDPLGLYPWGRYPWGDTWSKEECQGHCAIMAGVSSIPPSPRECPYNAISLETCLINCGNMDSGLMPEPEPGDSWDPWPDPVGVNGWLFVVCSFIVLAICKFSIITKKHFRVG